MKDFLHRYFWQNLSREFRRSLLFTATRSLAPSISPDAGPCEPIIVAGAFKTASGLGQSARLCYEAFRACGVQVYGIDLTSALRQPIDYPDYHLADGRGVAGPGTLILHVNSPFVPLALLMLGRPVTQGKWTIGYWHWELPRATAEWRHGVSRVHEIWTPSHFTAAAMMPISDGKPIRILPHPVALGYQLPPHRPGASDGSMTALMVFNMASGFERKNPLAAIAAFKAAFGSDPKAQMVIKVVHAECYPVGHRALLEATGSIPNVTLIDRMIDEAAMKSLYDRTDVVMSLHRSEGFGLVVAEAMLSGLPALSTNWSSTTDFLTPSTGVPVGYKLVPAIDPQASYHDPSQLWAEADVEDAAAKLIGLRDPALRQDIGEAAQAAAVRMFSPQTYVDQAFTWIRRSASGQP